MNKRLKAFSMYRHNGGAAVKREHGSSTITEFWVYLDKKGDTHTAMVKIMAKGPTPGERKTGALKTAEEHFRKSGQLS